jgi:hypothetical protein
MRNGLWCVLALPLACSGEQGSSPASGGDAVPLQTAPPTASPVAAPESAPQAGTGAAPAAAPRAPAADTTAARSGAAKSAKDQEMAERPLRDSAFGPKFTVDSAGKVKPIKKP